MINTVSHRGNANQNQSEISISRTPALMEGLKNWQRESSRNHLTNVISHGGTEELARNWQESSHEITLLLGTYT